LALFKEAIKYLEGPIAQWDVNAEDVDQIEGDNDNPLSNAILVGIPLDGIVASGDDDDGGSGVDIVCSQAQDYMDFLDVGDHSL